MRQTCLVPLAAIAICVTLSSAGADERPNILLIVSEDNGPELGCYGEPSVRTPALDQLAKEGVRFENAFVPQAGCSQSRAAFLTGLYPHQNGQIGLATWKFRMYREDTPNIVRNLKQSGYRTGLIGKLHVNPASAFPFDVHEIATSNFSRKKLGQYAESARRFMASGDEPFFLSVNYPDAHRPFLDQVKGVPEQILTGADVKSIAYFGLDSQELRNQTASYYNCMNRLDKQVGELLEVLKSTGKADNTLVVYIGDHGADLLRGKRTSYEGGVRIPMIVRWPGRIQAEQVRKELVSTLDLMPTFLEAAQVKPIAGLPGQSLLTLLNDQSADWREYLFTEYHLHSAHNFYPQRTVRDARFKLIQNLQPDQINPGYAFTRKKFFDRLNEVVDASSEPVRSAYRRMKRPPEFELYDLEADPHEFRNLADTPSMKAELNRLKKELANWRNETDDPLLNDDNLQRLKAEVEACFVDGSPSKAKLELTYPEYFFDEPTQSSSAQQPNVLFIAVDDLRPALGCFGDRVAITPNIDRLAASGTTFTRAYCQLAVCSPSRLSVLTGMRPDTIRVWDLKTHFRNAMPIAISLPQHFRNGGYHTQSFGKIFHGSGKPSVDPPSWSVTPLYDRVRLPELRYRMPENLAGTGLKRSATEASNAHDRDYVDGIVCEAARAAMSELAMSPSPFFLAVGFRKPHLPFCAPRTYWDLYERDSIPLPAFAQHPDGAPEFAVRSWRELEGYTDIAADEQLTIEQIRKLRHGYYACVSYVDALIGQLLDQLQENGLAENTVIVLWGDHGYHLGEQGLWTKANNYELSTRVPLIIADPRQAGAGQKCQALVELVDIYPTLVELCGLKPNREVEGISLKPLLENPEKPWKTAVFSQYPRDRESHRHAGRGDIMGYAVRTKDHRYVEWRDSKDGRPLARELYDHTSDPHESTNVVDHPDMRPILKSLQTVLADGPESVRSKLTRVPSGVSSSIRN